jgi:hypothetical protein
MMDWPEAITLCCWGICGAFAYYTYLRTGIRMSELVLEEREQTLEEQRFRAENPTMPVEEADTD